MGNRWDEVVVIAREIEHARSIGAPIDPQKARRLAELVLTLEHNPPRAVAAPLRAPTLV